ncbi:MAG: alpha/beta hydrolase [Candidatus Thorarchaeota archaeon]|nr:alpha/beta hydrolase [Candidatus Thorarchaeota archaeon]
MNEDVIFGKKTRFQSDVLNEERSIFIRIPDGYEESDDIYPVVYLLGGGYSSRFVNTAATIQLLSDSGRAPSMIVIGIDDIHHSRDNFPAEFQERSGEAHRFLEFITDELIPYVGKNYRTAPYSMLMGGSNTAMFALYAMLERPEIFNAYVAISPMIGWDGEFFQEKVKAFFKKKRAHDIRLYIAYGSMDYEHTVEYIPDFIKLFEKAGPDELKWRTDILEGEGHVPVPGLYSALMFIFPSWVFPADKLGNVNLDEIIKFYQSHSQNYGYEVKIPESVLSDHGYQLFMKGETERAINVLR